MSRAYSFLYKVDNGPLSISCCILFYPGVLSLEKSLAMEVLTWHTAPVVLGFECQKAKGDK